MPDMKTKSTFAEWRTLAVNRLLGGTKLLSWVSAAKWAIYPSLVRWTPRVALAIHEPESSRAFWNAISTGMTVVDAGANRGGFSVLASARTGPSGRVFAFEPEPANFATLVRRMQRFTNVTPVQAAVSSSVGTAVLHLDSFHAGHSLTSVAAGPAVSEVTVPVTTLDAFARDRGLTSIDVVKLDVEGVELDAIAGMRELMSGPNPPIILCEIHTPNRPEDVIELVAPYGYVCDVLDADLTGRAHVVPVHVYAVPKSRRV